MTSYVDRVVLHVAGGDGGPGCASVHREKFKPLGGPDGGNGGHGGSVELVVDPGVHTLLDVHHHPHQQARPGRGGQGSNRSGADGEGRELRVPDGTTVTDVDGTPIADLVGPGTRFVVAQGGRGGLGNAALASHRRKAPGFALLGEPAEKRDVVLELKSVADAGLVGFPSAGKSSLIAAMSAARPKVADYPFTTLVPHLGVVAAGTDTFTMADVPGLIPGAATGRGLGLEFLRHIERCAVLVHVLDPATEEPDRDPLGDLDALEAELAAYGDLEDRPRLVVLTKMDVPAARDMADLVEADLRARGLPVYRVSAVSHEGLADFGYALAAAVSTHRAQAPAAEPTRIVIRPEVRDTDVVSVEPSEDGFVVRGPKPERWVRQTDFSNDEAVGYLADRLARIGVEERLATAGAVAGSSVTIGEVSFDWEPTVSAGGGAQAVGARGSDVRLESSDRVRADDRLAAKKSRHRDAVSRAAVGARTPADPPNATDGEGTELDAGRDVR